MTTTGSRELADRLFWEAQRAILADRNWRGRRVQPGALDIEKLAAAGSITTNPNPIERPSL